MESYSSISKRDGGGRGLSLAALLAIAIFGGVLLFSTIGLLMAWHLKHRQRRSSARAFTLPDEYSQTRLTKRPLIVNELAVSGLSTRMASRLSLSMPPVLALPPMPSYNSLKWFFLSPEKKKKRRPRSWIGADDFHAPHVYTDTKDDRWLGWGSTIPSLALAESGHAQEYEMYHAEAGRLQKPPPPLGKPELVVQKRRRDNLPPSQTAPVFNSDAPRGRQSAVRVPAQAHVRPSVTTMDMGLREILQSTDKRLREGASRSPVKTPQGSPTRGSQRGSPVKTPHSHRSNSSRGTGRGGHYRKTPSPTKSGNLSTSSTVAGDGHSRDVSATSIGSAANSLLAEATQQLELPGGKASPSRLQGREWEPYGDQILPPSKTPLQSPHHSPRRSPQRSPERRNSYESDQSSSLSTLYSVGDEEAEVQPQYNVNYPIGQAISKYSWQAPPGMAPINVLAHRRSKTTSPEHIMAWQTQNSPLNKPLRPLSVNAKPTGRDLDSMRQPPPPQPVFKHHMDLRRNEEEELLNAEIPSVPSESSFTSESVHSNDSVQQSEPTCETPRPEWLPDHNHRRSPTASPVTPGKSEIDNGDMSSSPYSEEDIVAMLLQSGGTKRALPVPPTMVTAPDGTIVPAGLSPRPSVRSDRSNPALLERSTSNASSVYSAQPPARQPASTGSPTRRSTIRSRGQPQALSVTIAELRRMNSLVSSYSQASVASSAASDMESPTLPSLTSFNGGGGGGGGTAIIAPRTQKPIGSKHYLNISRKPPHKNRSAPNLHKVAAGSRIPALAKAESEGTLKPKKPLKSALKKPRPTQTPHKTPAEEGKENRSVGDPKTPVAEPSPRVKELRERASRESTPTGPSPKSSPSSQIPKPKAWPVKHLIAQEMRRAEKRESVESLGLYDQDGFLLSSPDRDVRRSGLRT